jgi:hypothetical protein
MATTSRSVSLLTAVHRRQVTSRRRRPFLYTCVSIRARDFAHIHLWLQRTKTWRLPASECLPSTAMSDSPQCAGWSRTTKALGQCSHRHPGSNFGRRQHARKSAYATEDRAGLRSAFVHPRQRSNFIRIGRTVASCVIRMLRGPELDLNGVPLFWLELFDLSAGLSLDSCCCHRIEDAVPVFEGFVAQAAAMSQPGGEPL